MTLLSADYWNKLRERQAILREKINHDFWRLKFHLMPETGWMNDPNGVCQFNGVYHFYHQYVPGNPDGGEPPHWGHKTSTDMVHFKEEEIFLSPEHDYDRNGVYSGSAIVHDGALHFFYTGNVKKDGDYDYIYSGREQNTVHVVSKDGFTIDQQTVVIPHADYPEGFSDHIRDPKVFEHDGTFYMILGGRTRDNEGKILVFESRDLDDWTYKGDFFGDNYALGYMWECPDFFATHPPTDPNESVLILSPQGIQSREYAFQNVYQAGYLIGEVDWEKIKFDEKSEFEELDRGFDFYAPQTFEDESGRRILWGWMGIGDTKPEYVNPTIARGWQHAATLPRELTVENGQLKQRPLVEYQTLRQAEQVVDIDLEGYWESADLKGEVYELDLVFEGVTNVSLFLREDTALSYTDGVLALTHGPSGFGRKKRAIELPELRRIQLFMDTSSIELFINDGSYVMTSRVFPAPGEDQLTFDGKAKISLRKWDLQK